MSARKLWMVSTDDGMARPESKVKAYSIYVGNAQRDYPGRVAAYTSGRRLIAPSRYAEVWVDVRDGRGWQLHERIDLTAEPTS